MNDINIVYDIEKDCGLEEKIRSQSSVAFTSPLCTVDGSNSEIVLDSLKKLPSFASSELKRLSDDQLYHVYSILVSTVWNRNDDVFDREEVWAARNTPKFKPTNLEHDEKQMVGGIVDSWPVDMDFNLIDDNTEASQLPEDYHLLVSSVIYRQWQDPELKARAEQLIAEIEAGDKYVSMECLFRGFDYGVMSPDGTNHVVPRNQSTAFLTQHLRAYGGTGKYQEHKVGRVLRKISFSGKGFVNRPANPDSIIFEREHVFSFANVEKGKSLFLDSNGVSSNTEKQLSSEVIISDKENRMSNELLSDQVKELKDALASVQAENKELTDKLAEASISTYESEIAKLSSTVAELNEAVEGLKSQLTEAAEQKESLESELATKSEALEQVQADMHKMEEDKKKKERKAKMVEAGLSDEEVEAKFETFAELSEEVFNSLLETIAMMHEDKEKKKKMKEEAMKDYASDESTEAEEEAEEDSTEASELIEGETEEGDIAVSSETDVNELSTARAGLQKWVEDCIINQKESK